MCQFYGGQRGGGTISEDWKMRVVRRGSDDDRWQEGGEKESGIYRVKKERKKVVKGKKIR